MTITGLTNNEYKKNHTITIGIDAPLQFPVLFREIIQTALIPELR
jgi:hypothetical protein